MNGLKALGVICASVATGLALSALASLLPDNPYQRWQLTDGTIFDQLRWSYERINFDERPVDVAIVGPSRSLLGLSAERISRQLAARGQPANVANFSVVAAGRNVQWAILDELFRKKAPKIVVIAVDGRPFFYGHPAFKSVAAASDIAFPPAPLLHNYPIDLAHLPSRQVKLFAANLFPGQFGLRKEFDPAIYANTRSEFTSGILHLDNKVIDMDRRLSAETLREQAPKTSAASPLTGQLLKRCCSNDDHTYIKAIAEEARAHGVRLIFVFLPTFERDVFEDRDFLSQYGQIVDDSDMSKNPDYYENWSHFGHSGSMEASDRIASAIANMRTSKLDQGKTK